MTQEQLNEEMKKSSSVGNKPTVSRKKVDSNGEQVQEQPLKSKAEMETDNLPLNNKKVSTKSTDYQPNFKSSSDFYKPEEFNAQEADKLADNYLQRILANARETENMAQDRADRKGRAAKIAAWGNMFNALGQLAGAGKNTYVKPDNSFLRKALSDADRARDIYDNLTISNKQRAEQAKLSYVDMLRKQNYDFNKIRLEQAGRDASEYNKNERALVQSNVSSTTKEYNNNNDYKERALGIQAGTLGERIRANKAREELAAEKLKNSGGSKTTTKPYAIFHDEDSDKQYYMNEAQANRVAGFILENQKEFPIADLSMIQPTVLQQYGSDYKKAQYSHLIQRFLGMYKDNPKVKQLLSGLDSNQWSTDVSNANTDDDIDFFESNEDDEDNEDFFN